LSVIRRLVKTAVPVSRVTVALWAWRNRDELLRWAGFVAGIPADILDGRPDDVITEAKLRTRLTADSRTRGAEGLRVSVTDGVATLSGVVDPEVHDVALDLASATSGVKRVRDELTHPGRPPKFSSVGSRS
jgi:hypothetical protein